MENATKNWENTERDKKNVWEDTGKEVEKKAHEIKDQAKEALKHGEDSVKKAVTDLDRRLHDDPWTVVAGVAVASLLLGFIMGGSKK